VRNERENEGPTAPRPAAGATIGVLSGAVALGAAELLAADGIDCAVICTDHKVFDYAAMAKRFPIVVDTRNALKDRQAPNIFRL